MDKIKVIYIAGNGHSGSTVLDLILGSNANTISVGELRQWNNYIRGHSNAKHQISDFKNCTCGETFHDCAFWSQISKDITLPRDRIKLLKEVSKISGKKIIIDSSKNIEGLLQTTELHRKGEIDLQVIYLVRHFNGMLFSHQKIGYSFFEAMRDWLRYQIKLPKIVAKVPHILIRYEELGKEREKTLVKISNFVGFSLKDYEKKINKTTYHNICGNPIRFKEFKGIKLDEAWKGDFNPIKRFVGEIINTFGNLFV